MHPTVDVDESGEISEQMSCMVDCVLVEYGPGVITLRDSVQ